MLIRHATPGIEDRLDAAHGDMRGNGHKGINTTVWLHKIYSEFEDRLALTQDIREEEEDNHRVYSGLRHSQWHKDVIAQSSGKDLSQFNFVMKKVNSVVGNLVRNWWDIDFVSVDGTGSDDLIVIKDLYFADKEICDWDHEIHDFLKNGVIKSADLLVFVDYRHDPNFGNIAVKNMLPGSVLWDTNWLTRNSGQARNCYTMAYMSANEMIDRYPQKKERIETMLYLESVDSDSDERPFDGFRDSVPHQSKKDSYNRTYRVIEYHNMRTEMRDHSFGLSENGQFIGIPPEPTEEWFVTHGVDPDSVVKQKHKTDVYYVTAFCPELDMSEPLEDRPGMLQVGRIPIVHWSYNRHNGQDIGYVDVLKDPQRYYNEMMSLIHDIIKNTRRVKIIDPAMFGDTADLDDLRTKFKKGNEVVFSEPDASREYPNGIQDGSPSTPMGQELNFANNIMGTIEQLSPITTAMEGVGGNERSAVQFDLKREQGEVNMALLYNSVKLFINELAEVYFYSAPSLYGGMYRKIKSPKGVVEINVPTQDGVLNDLLSLPRAKVIVTESPAAISRRTSDRAIMMQVLQQLGDDPLVRADALNTIFGSLESIPAERKVLLESAFEMQKELAINSMALQNENTKLQLLQIETAMQQMLNPQPQMPQEGGMGQEGAPQEGAPQDGQEVQMGEEQLMEQMI